MNTRSAYPLIARFACAFVVLLSLTFAQPVAAQDGETVGVQGGRFGLGFATSWPSYGVSGTLQVSPAVTAEAIFGFFGTISNYGGRAWYRFSRNPTYDLYGYAGASLYRYQFTRFVDFSQPPQSATESVVGVGGGAGLEVGLRSLFTNEALPPVFFNWEVGLAMASFDHFNFSSFVYGGGVRYRFGN